MDRRLFVGGLAIGAAFGASAAPPAPPASSPEHERSRIDRLIRYVASQQGLVFIRNGAEHSCTEAAKFLRGKLEAMGADVTTARDFIDRIGSKSSMSGKPYHVRFADGRTMLASQFLHDELRRMEAGSA